MNDQRHLSQVAHRNATIKTAGRSPDLWVVLRQTLSPSHEYSQWFKKASPNHRCGGSAGIVVLTGFPIISLNKGAPDVVLHFRAGIIHVVTPFDQINTYQHPQNSSNFTFVKPDQVELNSFID